MNLAKNAALTDAEIDWLKYGNDDSVLCFSKMDGFLTAIVCGPNIVSPNIWFRAL